ncbi:hypothetical protein ACUIAL_08935 [Dermabacteraceae bacterium P13136]
MATPRKKGTPGRPSKGDRHTFMVRVPREYASRVMSYAKAVNMPYGEVIADQVIKHIDDLDVDAEQLSLDQLEALQKTG